MAPRKELGYKGKEGSIRRDRSRSRSVHSHHSIPGSYGGYEEENTVIGYEHRDEERGITAEQEQQKEEQTNQELQTGELVIERAHWKELTDRFNKMKEKNREYRQREEELKNKLLDEQAKLEEERARNRDLRKELEEAKKPERVAPQKMELSRLRTEVAVLQQENSNLRRQITPEVGPAPRSPPPTETFRVSRATFQLPPRRIEPEETDDGMRTPAYRITPQHQRPILAPTPDSVAANWRPRGDHPAKKLSGSNVNEYRPWRFQVGAKLETDSPLYPNDKSKVTYALTQMEDPLFSAMQEWVIAQDGCRFDDLLSEIRLYMGIQFQEHDAEKTLLTITQKEKESITEYYHRISALWNIAQTSENQRIRKFVTSIRPTISTSLLNQTFTSIKEALENARIVEERRKDIDTNYPRSFAKNRAPGQSATTKQTQGTSWTSDPPSGQVSTRTGSHPNNRFGPVAKKPSGWIGSWYNPEDKPKRLTEELKNELTKQGRCWSCRGSGHRGADSVCPRPKRLDMTAKEILAHPESDTDSENE